MSNDQRVIIVTGGAGYLGRCTVEGLLQEGYRPIILDNLCTGHASAMHGADSFDVDLTDLQATRTVFSKIGRIHGIIHFAAKALVSESCEQPQEYFRNNLLSTLNTAALSLEHAIPAYVHSSSCAVYGTPKSVPIQEDTPFAPLSPYGETKAMAERMFFHFKQHKKLNVLNLRYFNPAGAYQAKFGERHEPETHLIPRIVDAALQGNPVFIYGIDYPTPDGTCIRDFFHVEDLVAAHIAALRLLEREPACPTEALNLGSGRGYSVKEVIQTAEKVLQRSIATQAEPRRAGDPPKLTADISAARSRLQWEPKKNLEQMISDHYHWTKMRLQ